MTVRNSLQTINYGNKLTIHTGEQPTAVLLTQIFIHSQQYATGVITSNDAAIFVCIDVQDIVQIGIFCIGYIQTEFLHQAKTETFLCFGVILNRHVTTLGHHHLQVLFQFLCCIINGAANGSLVNLIHYKPHKYAWEDGWSICANHPLVII